MSNKRGPKKSNSNKNTVKQKNVSKQKSSNNIKTVKNKRKVQMKHIRRRRLVVLLVAVIFIGIVTIYNLKGTGGNELSNYMDQGNNYVIANDYTKAVASYQEVLKIDSNNNKAKDLVNILQNYIKAEQCYQSGDVQDAKIALGNINPDYTRYPIGVKINQLKSELNSKQNQTSQGKENGSGEILTLSNLYTNGKYKEALALIEKLDKENLNDTQQAYVSEVTTSIDQKLGIDSSKNNQFYEKGKYLNELSQLNIAVNNMELGASSYEQKLQRAKDKYAKWNDELNKILSNLQKKLSATEMAKLQSDENNWANQMQSQAKQSEAKYSNQLVKETANYQTQRDLTEQRCYTLVNDYM